MSERPRRVPPVLLAALLAAAAVRPAAGEPDPGADPHATVRGMTVSCHAWGWEWGTDEMVQTLETLSSLGVNWVAIHPYASIRADGTVAAPDRWYQDAEWIRRPIREAHRLGLKIMIKPHLAYWGSPFSWRGEIAFATLEQWERFFSTYERWITRVAELSEDADAFVVGTELDRTVHHEQAWRSIIQAVRARIQVPLTYSANWDTFERVGFWDALDVIGIQSYFPLVDHDRTPSDRELRAGWDRLIARLEAYARRHHRRILLAELGYNRSALAAARPWAYEQGGTDAAAVQQRCLESAMEAMQRSDAIVGAFLWKWFPGESRRGNFLMSEPAIRQIIAGHWGRP
ncbi:MAG: glycoside hydrolase family 113 [Planctomycetota bacterium]